MRLLNRSFFVFAAEASDKVRDCYVIKEKLGSNTRVIGLTATATKAAQNQICDIFDIDYPKNIVTQPDLSRMNL